MKSKKDIIALVKNITRRQAGLPDRRMMHPNREWAVSLLFSFCLLVAGGVYAWIMFDTHAGVSVESEVVEVDKLNYRQDDAQTAIEFYSKKRTAYDSLWGERSVLVAEEVVPERESDQDEGSEEGEPEEVTTEEVVAEAEGDTEVPDESTDVIDESDEEESGDNGEGV